MSPKTDAQCPVGQVETTTGPDQPAISDSTCDLAQLRAGEEGSRQQLILMQQKLRKYKLKLAELMRQKENLSQTCEDQDSYIAQLSDRQQTLSETCRSQEGQIRQLSDRLEELGEGSRRSDLPCFPDRTS